MTPQEVIANFILTWEGGLSLHKSDTGNWVNGKLIGSKYGVTAAALAGARGVPVASITAPVMAALTIQEAAAIGMAKYYLGPRLNLLPWNRVTASLLDMGWGAGPVQAIKLWQRMIGVPDDGKVGPATAAATKAYIGKHGEDLVAVQWAFIRANFYADITERNPANVAFLNGWFARTEYFTPTAAPRAKGWWDRWQR
ncbi:MAG: putative peptidoglycan-binding domain-containing protein [Sphingobium sp.]